MPYLSYFIKCLLHLILFKSVQIYTIQIIKVTYSTLFSFKSDNFYTSVTISLICKCKSFFFLFYFTLKVYLFIIVTFNVECGMLVTYLWTFYHTSVDCMPLLSVIFVTVQVWKTLILKAFFLYFIIHIYNNYILYISLRNKNRIRYFPILS